MTCWHPLPAEVHSLVEREPATVLLENSDSRAVDPISRLFTAPVREIAATGPADLPALFAEIESATAAGQFAAGFFTYECGEAFEPKTAMHPGMSRSLGRPLAWFGIYERSYQFDHARGVFADGEPTSLSALQSTSDEAGATDAAPLEVICCLTEQEYADRIAAIHEWIRAGDVYQLNFTFPLRIRFAGGQAALYDRLRRRQPVQYGALLHWHREHYLLSFSPELFFRLERHGATRRMTTRPMKGTARRGRTTAEDRQIAENLRGDAKSRAENVMIVDLLRNDLGRLCEFGGVEVENLFATERYSTLWQMTSTIRGVLRSDVGFEQILRAMFPCGSVTGAPKVRAMQLLGQIEEEPRGVYTGAIGFFSRERSVFNVAIRTLELNGEKCAMGVGSGIVIDSNAAEEFRECALKAEFLTDSEEAFSLIETVLWEGRYPLLELHLDRLEDSADYFDFFCDRASIKAALLSLGASFSDEAARKVRLLLDRAGELRIEHDAITHLLAGRPGRVCISARNTSSSDRFLFHKTTHRDLYSMAYEAAQGAGCDDVLFFNERGELTEGAISNVFVERNSRWLTPPIDCGVLPGVYRRHLLMTRPEIEERVLYHKDLQAADAIYLANAVRGLRRVSVAWDSQAGNSLLLRG